DRRQLVPWSAYLKLLLTALWKLPTVTDTVWRGVRTNLSNDYKRDTICTWWAVSSCTSSIEVLESSVYVGNTGQRTIFSIQCQRGKRIRHHSYFQKEEEILLMPGTYLKVVSQMNAADGLHIIHLKEIEPPIQLLLPPFDTSKNPSVTPSLISSFSSSNVNEHNGICSKNLKFSMPKTNDEFVHLVWLAANSENNIQIKIELQNLYRSFDTFDTIDRCDAYIRENREKTIVLIVSGRFGREIVPRIHDLSQLKSIYVFCMDKAEHEKWAKHYKKVEQAET
ncbi:unnamed protein product, partial [Didymodactylos carnosus]